MKWCWVNFHCRGVLLIWTIVGQGPTSLTVGAGGGCLDVFTLRPRARYGLPPNPRGSFVDNEFLNAQCLRSILQHVRLGRYAVTAC